MTEEICFPEEVTSEGPESWGRRGGSQVRGVSDQRRGDHYHYVMNTLVHWHCMSLLLVAKVN